VQRSLASAGLFFLALTWSVAGLAQGDAKRGEYLAAAGGCVGCHTSEQKGSVPFAGGRALKTPFGTFYGPNLTPHAAAGLGRWSEADFIRAMREGLRPDGANYFPAFPYTSFTRIADADLRDLWAYLRSLPPNAKPSEPHDLWFIFRWRLLLWPWKWMFFTAGAFQPDPKVPAVVNRGAYLAQALGHCGECHTPRNFLGGAKQSRFLAGGKIPGGPVASNLTPTRLKKWGDKDLADFFGSGMTPDGDVVGDTMGEVITNTTGKLTAPDLAALIAYLRTLPPLPDEPK